MRRLVGMLIAVFAALAVSTSSTAQNQIGAEPMIAYNPANNHYYAVIAAKEAVSWLEATKAAAVRQVMGVPGHLVTVTSDAELKWMAANVFTNGSWLGAYQNPQAPDYNEPDAGWRWVTGEPWGFTSWNEKEPNNSEKGEDVASIVGNEKWNDASIHAKGNAYVVEYPTTGPDPQRGQRPASEQIDQLLTRIARAPVRSYSATVEFSLKARVDTLAAIRRKLTIQPPGRFRLEARGTNGSLIAVADGRAFLMARTKPGERMQYLVKPLRSLNQALSDALSLMIESPLPPSITSFLDGSANPQLWSGGGRIGELSEETKEQTIRSKLAMHFLGEDPIDAEAALKVSLGSLRPTESEVSYRYKAFPFTARETHSDIQVNQAIPPETFTFQPTPTADRVDDLGEMDPEVTYRPRR